MTAEAKKLVGMDRAKDIILIVLVMFVIYLLIKPKFEQLIKAVQAKAVLEID